MRSDQAWTLLRARFNRRRADVAFDGDPRIALITVNFSTTRYLKLMLLTLSEQRALALVHRIVVVDNYSRDGGASFLRALQHRVPRMHLVERRYLLSHARGMRAGVRLLDRVEHHQHVAARANLLLFSDADVAYRRSDALGALARVVIAQDASLAGEIRHGVNPEPDIQASFFIVRRDAFTRRDVAPLVHHGSPAYWLQRSIRHAGLSVADFPGNQDGFVLHRGRAGVKAARLHHPWHSCATVDSHQPHFMGLPDGPNVWAAIEAAHVELLDGPESALLDVLANRFAVLSTAEANRPL